MQQKMSEIASIVAALESQKKKQIMGSAKAVTLIVLLLTFGFGIFGSFNKVDFNMAEYVTFLESFTWFFAPLIVSIGAGSVTSSLVEKKKETTNETT